MDINSENLIMDINSEKYSTVITNSKEIKENKLKKNEDILEIKKKEIIEKHNILMSNLKDSQWLTGC